jgi:hypothetical protein
VVDRARQVGERGQNVVRAGGGELAIGGGDPAALGGLVQSIPFFLREADFAACRGDAEAPAAGVDAFFDVGDRVADFNDAARREDVEPCITRKIIQRGRGRRVVGSDTASGPNL